MNQNNLFNQKQLNKHFKYLRDVVKQKIKNEYDNFLLSDKFLKVRHEFEETEEYKTIKNNESKIKEVFNKIFPNLISLSENITENKRNLYDILYIININLFIDGDSFEEKYQFNRFIYNVKRKVLKEVSITEEGSLDKLISIFEEHINDYINNEKENYAINKLKLTNCFKQTTYNKLVSWLQTVAITDQETLKNMMLREFDFSKEIFEDYNEEFINWNSTYSKTEEYDNW